MTMSPAMKKNVTVGAVVVVLLGGAAYFLWGRADTTPTVTVSGDPGSADEATFLSLATELDTVTFDPAIFTDPRFTSLRDIHTNIVPEAQGRRDPFAALPGLNVAAP